MKKISVILSIYKPNTTFLKKQLKSIDDQTYNNTELVIRNDCPDTKLDKKIIKECIKNKKIIYIEDKLGNLGYTKSFEELVKSIKHDGYIAFCDQDDIWEKDKLSLMIKTLEKEEKDLCVCDRYIIDENDKIVSEIKNADNPVWNNYEDLFNQSPFLAIAPGMSIVCKASFAKKNLPYHPFAFDKYLTCCAIFENQLTKIDKSLVRYRRHGNNVSGVLNGINDKTDYYNSRVKHHDELVRHLIKKYPAVDTLKMKEFSDARINKKIFKLYKYRKVSNKQAIFEILLALTPNFIFKTFIKMKRGK